MLPPDVLEAQASGRFYELVKYSKRESVSTVELQVGIEISAAAERKKSGACY